MTMEIDQARFAEVGYVRLPGLFRDDAARLLSAGQALLDAAEPPLEFEADVGYPGAPAARDRAGGQTVRRLLNVYGRGEPWRMVPHDRRLREPLQSLLGAEVFLAQAHHNCLMTKNPRFSSRTMWHQDIRYWSFSRRELISAWLALGPERSENGALWVVPGSHRPSYATHRFDADKFFRPELPENAAELDRAVEVQLNAGDVLLFHCRLLHAAGANQTPNTKFSLVYTFHGVDDRPLPGTRSSSMPSVPLVEISYGE